MQGTSRSIFFAYSTKDTEKKIELHSQSQSLVAHEANTALGMLRMMNEALSRQAENQADERRQQQEITQTLVNRSPACPQGPVQKKPHKARKTKTR